MKCEIKQNLDLAAANDLLRKAIIAYLEVIREHKLRNGELLEAVTMIYNQEAKND